MNTLISKEQIVKVCPKCKVEKPFYKKSSWCKSCQGEYKKSRIPVKFPNTEDYVKVCNKCKEEKIHSPRGCWCKDCWSAQRIEYVKKNHKELKAKDVVRRKEKIAQDPLHFRKRMYRLKYNITIEDYNLMLKDQNYSCAICETDTPGGRSIHFHVDHCHTTGNVRGLLCAMCNFGLGAFRDSLTDLASAIKYLKNSNDDNRSTYK